MKFKCVEERFKTITLHVDVLNSILFSKAHSQQILISDCNFLGESQINTISSANPKLEIIILSSVAPKLDLFNFSVRSLMKIKNKIGPSLLPAKPLRGYQIRGINFVLSKLLLCYWNIYHL